MAAPGVPREPATTFPQPSAGRANSQRRVHCFCFLLSDFPPNKKPHHNNPSLPKSSIFHWSGLLERRSTGCTKHLHSLRTNRVVERLARTSNIVLTVASSRRTLIFIDPQDKCPIRHPSVWRAHDLYIEPSLCRTNYVNEFA